MQPLPMQPLGGANTWTGTLLDRFGIGANGRVAARIQDPDDRDDHLNFDVDRVTVYGSATLNKHVLLYVDQHFAPGGSANREAWIRLAWQDFYLRAGGFFLPYGWRLEDNGAFIRRSTGVTMAIEHFDGELDDRFRYSLVSELSPWPFTQIRAGIRVLDSDDPDPRLNSEEGFVQLHAYF